MVGTQRVKVFKLFITGRVDGAFSPASRESEALRVATMEGVEEPLIGQEEEEEEGEEEGEEEEEEEFMTDREREQAIAFQWLKQLHLVPMRHSREYPEGTPTDVSDHPEDIDGIITHMQVGGCHGLMHHVQMYIVPYRLWQCTCVVWHTHTCGYICTFTCTCM